MTDRLTLSRALEEGGTGRAAAERIAIEIFDAIHENTATKDDLESVKAELLLRLSELEHRMTTRFGSVMVVVTGIILAEIRYLPHS